MNYIKITAENIDREHICCAMSGKQSIAKKEWMKQRFDEGLVFYRSEERGKCFIEYIPAENAWVPIEADGYMYINCLWIAGSMKDTDIPTICCVNVSATLKQRAKRAFVYCRQTAGKESFFPILHICRIKALPSPTRRIAALH